MHKEMITNAQSHTVESIRCYLDLALNPPSAPINTGLLHVTAINIWAEKVRPGGAWDHKPILADMLRMRNDPAVGGSPDFWFPIRGDDSHEYYYDIWSNIHFGYVGRAAGLDAQSLQAGANIPVLAGTNDIGDVVSIDLGIELWEEHGLQLTEEQLHDGILRYQDLWKNLPDESDKIIPGINWR
jgi:hypothetical protein